MSKFKTLCCWAELCHQEVRQRTCWLCGIEQVELMEEVVAVAARLRADEAAAIFVWREKEEEEALDDGVVEDEQGDTQKLHRIYENLNRDNIMAVNGSVTSDGKATEQLYQIHKVDEINSSELLSKRMSFDLLYFGFQVSEAVENYDHNSVSQCAEITADGMVSEHVEKYDHNSDMDCAEITTPGMGTTSVTENDDNSSKNITENKIIVHDCKGAVNSDERTVSLSNLGIAHEEHDNHNCVAQDTTSTESAANQEQFSEEMKMAEMAEERETTPMAETVEVKLEEESVITPMVETEVNPAEESVATPMPETAEESETTPMAETAEESDTTPMAETESDTTPMAPHQWLKQKG
uniref:Uncharacterized protein n=1 Tax=Oryza brachyantha TaxID=4533 RepID=J3NE17_ORYBR